MPLHISLKQFDGPLDLLLHLIGKAKIDIKDIFVSQITEQYIESVHNAIDLDMNDASEFLVMAATLIEIKSRTLLPRPTKEDEGEETPEDALIRQLEEYKRCKESADELHSFEQAAANMYVKLPEEYPLPPPSFELTGLTLDGLIRAFETVISRMTMEKNEETRHNLINRNIKRDIFTVQECMLNILRRMKAEKCIHFETLFTDKPCKEEVVTLFLALLEILKLGKAHVEQDGVYDSIMLLPGRRNENDCK